MTGSDWIGSPEPRIPIPCAPKRCLAAAAAIRPHSAAARACLGIVLLKNGDVDGAVRAHRDALRINRALVAGHHNVGLALHKKGRPPEAADAVRAARRLAPDSAATRTVLADILSPADLLHKIPRESEMEGTE